MSTHQRLPNAIVSTNEAVTLLKQRTFQRDLQTIKENHIMEIITQNKEFTPQEKRILIVSKSG